MLGCRLSLANLLSLYLSTEYTDEIYMQKASLSLNVRLFNTKKVTNMKKMFYNNKWVKSMTEILKNQFIY